MSTFPSNVIAAAQDAQRRWNVFASVSLAQWALESNYGQTMPSGSNNPFGIKAVAGQAFVSAWTHETINGQYVKVEQKFAAYATLDAAFEAHGRLLATSQYYVKAQHADSPKSFAMDLQGIYATGIPGHPYGAALIAIMDANDLYQYDLTSTQALNAAPPDLSTGKGVQQALHDLGVDPSLVVDGAVGPKTRAAIKAFQTSHSLTADGLVGQDTINALKAALENVSTPRAAASAPPQEENPMTDTVAPATAPRVTPTASMPVRVSWGDWLAQALAHETPIIEAVAETGVTAALSVTTFGSVIAHFIGPTIVKQYVDMGIAALIGVVDPLSADVPAGTIFATVANLINANEAAFATFVGDKLGPMLTAELASRGIKV